MTRSYYSAPVKEFLRRDPGSICGALANSSGFAIEDPQRFAWQFQIPHLHKTLRDSTEGHVFIEFQIPRSARRADVILLRQGVIFVLEYKVGGSNYDRSSIDQVTDYALDLKNFHSGSHHLPIVPILIATAAKERLDALRFQKDGVAEALLANEHTLGRVLSTIPDFSVALAVDPIAWEQSPYSPTPTIVEAAQALYRGHRVTDISRSDAGAINLTRTSSCVAEIIRRAEGEKEKSICFLTGVPGAGKTLAGLNIVTSDNMRGHETAPTVFLSGNGPLVMVLREALALDDVDQHRESPSSQRPKMSSARRKASAFIQNIHHFRDDNLRSNIPPAEHVVVFDEAQRAWDKPQTSQFMRRKKGVPDFDMSEPEFLLSVMDRHQDWCCVICLIGGGQEINIGEAGMVEWLSALQRRFTSWVVYCSDQMGTSEYSWNTDLLSTLQAIGARVEPDLHLSVSLRSFRAESVSAFVSAIVIGDSAEASRLSEKMPNYPVAMTRNLDAGRAWIRRHARGTERYGVLASSNAIRLKPLGIHVRQKVEAAKWFLKDKEDIRSSFYLEDVATEFDVQGLELDWALVCWDANFRRSNSQWSFHNFSGSRWKNVRDESQRRYIANAYRVLLTRARQGLVIFVPQGDPEDPTRPPAFYDGIYNFLNECGVEEIKVDEIELVL